MKKENSPEVIEDKDVQIVQQSPMELAQGFLKAGGDLDSLEKMMDLEDRYHAKKAEMCFVKSMVKAQKGMPTIYEGRQNTQTNSQYAAYKDIVRDAKPIYTDAGLSVSFYEEDIEKGDYVRFCADVYHEDGHCKKYHVDLPIDDKGPKGTPVKTKIHGIKSAMSYGRGILLCNIFNIPTSADVDDDGNGAGNSGYEKITEEQAIRLREIIESIPDETEENFCDWAKIEKLDDGAAEYFNKYLNALKAKSKKNKE
ncbi:MAG: hypothetical protein GY941_23570 [Planctomycetes bacterium]|nr:hypothetical protein [Planctomycetota bacterium]